MQQIFAISRLAGLIDETVSLEHHPFGKMLGLDGKPFKTRAGGTIKLVDLIHEAIERAAKRARILGPWDPVRLESPRPGFVSRLVRLLPSLSAQEVLPALLGELSRPDPVQARLPFDLRFR